jgi:hypothetical protein
MKTCRKRHGIWLALVIAVVAAAHRAPAVRAADITLDARRSLAVTDQAILERFSFERVLGQLAAQSGVPGLTAIALFHQWWDTQNPGPGLQLGAHCDDTVDPTLGPLLNGYPYTCRPAPSEGAQASCDPFTDPTHSPCGYLPVGLFNRFDLSPEDGSNCGEYRIIFAKQTGRTNGLDRNLVIFEAALPNPHPQQGLKGCKQIVDVWADLTKEDSITRRADALEQFYFDGHGDVPPVVAIDHYGDNATAIGQIRSNQFSNIIPRAWSLREFKLLRSCAADSCSAMRLVPVTDKINPFGPLFDGASTNPNAGAFQGFFPSQTASLAGASVADISMSTPDVYNSGQSQASASNETKYAVQFGTGASALRTALAGELATLGSSLLPDDIVQRAQAMACAGCHRFSNDAPLGGGLRWPASTGFTHVNEAATEVVGGATRFVISPALTDAFLPHRKEVMEDFLNNKPRPSRGPKKAIGGREGD